MPERYNGQIIVPSAGPLDADVVLIGEAPAYHEVEAGTPFVGPAGRYLNKGLAKVGLPRQSTRIINLVPVRAPGDKFNRFDSATLEWGRERFEQELAQLENPKLLVALGANPFKWLTGIGGGPGSWHGSLLRPGYWPLVPNELMVAHPGAINRGVPVLATFHPAAVARQFNWMWLFLDDLRTGMGFLRGRWEPPAPKRWVVNRPEELPDFIDRIIRFNHLVSIDTELDPSWIIALATEDEVHAFAYEPELRSEIERLVTSPSVLKVAHNWNHDASFFKRVLGMDIVGPYFDTMGGAHLLDPEREKTLSPGISTRFTTYPYHKWLVHHDPIVYCGMDAAVCMDSYWPIIDELDREGLLELASHDHKLLRHLLDMQWEGIPVDDAERVRVEADLREDLNAAEDELREMVRPVIRSKLKKFRNPQLFYKVRSCPCCGGGSVARERCWRCAGFDAKPKKTELVELAERLTDGESSPGKVLKAELEAALLHPCERCGGKGKITSWKPFNPDSPKQVADVLYRGLGIRPRTYKRSETTRIERLQAIPNPPPLLQQHIATAQIRADYDTVRRLQPGLDGRLHCVFDPWGTVSGRVAGKEGLIDPGTNPMNLPYKARRFVKAPVGYGLMYPDMEQIEARCVAVLGDEEELKKIYLSGGDSHTKIMEMIYERSGWDMNDVDVGPHAGQGRFFTKKSTYAFMYGIRASFMAGELGIPVEMAEEILQILERTMPGVARYKLQVAEAVAGPRRMVTSPTRRRRIFRGRVYDTKTREVDYEILKKAWSFAPQDMAARVLAEGLFDMRDRADWIVPISHVHDALLSLFPLDRREEAVEIAVYSLSREMWGMWFPAGMSLGPDWYVASNDDDWKRENGYEAWVI